MVLFRSLLAIATSLLATTADSAAQPIANHEWQVYGNTINLGRGKRQMPEPEGGGKCMHTRHRSHAVPGEQYKN